MKQLEAKLKAINETTTQKAVDRKTDYINLLYENYIINLYLK